MAGGRIEVAVGECRFEVQTVPETGTQQTAGVTRRAAENVADAFRRAQDTIAEIARSTAEMIDRAGDAARPDHVEVEFGLGFTAAGGVIMAGVAGQATLKITLAWDPGNEPTSNAQGAGTAGAGGSGGG